MRIIAGTAKGRKLLSVPETMPVRPISDRIKQSLFDILRPRIPAGFFLDLFAGTGAVGLEALSRGAAKVCFVEKEKVCVSVIEKNARRMGFADKARVFRADVSGDLKWLAQFGDGGTFDIIFLGPPYRDAADRPLAFTSGVLANIASAGIAAPEGWIVSQRFWREAIVVPPGYELFRECKYGDTRVAFIRRGRP